MPILYYYITEKFIFILQKETRIVALINENYFY
ncbi:hypothetical protein PCC8801_4087 [Rippkaea orientalis PCC 8801]|uniref:Uncharacterized protein n=1 Tax=Rippkaea orientalis (strain PCC 8801 / RF-1) TaxID=41431 RepID=B7K5X0_RIPO1|nr:hypothetical protein PCC8801_4087 [Rippkaea orientalis PCC 8801]